MSMAWKCPECRINHNNIAQWAIINGKKVTGFCSDGCLNTYRAKHPETGKKPRGLGGLLLKGVKDTLTGFGS